MTRRALPLLDFVPAVTRRYASPRHLAPVASAIERIAAGETVSATVSCPPRHGKTDLIGHGIAWLLRLRPTMRIAYVTYAQTLSERKSRRFRALAEAARVKLDASAASLHDWRTIVPRGEEPGGLWATSIGGPFTGEGVDLLIVDDPVKDRMSAESSLVRERTHEWFTDTALTRLEPGGSVIVCMHRWHTDDLIGRLLETEGWDEIALPAIGDDGRALWPERYPLDKLHRTREQMGEYGWASLYQQRPRSRGGSVFAGVQFYGEVPTGGAASIAIGVDLAYSTKSRADHSVACVVARDAISGRCYVLDVVRRQVEAPVFLETLRALRQRYQGAPLVMYAGGTERGVIDTFRTMGVDIAARPATADKFTRAQPVAAAWSAGKVLVPGSVGLTGVTAPAWVDPFVAEVTAFTGADRHDDQVDALAAAYDELQSGGVDLSLLSASRDGIEPWAEPLGLAFLVIAGTGRETAAIVVQRQELRSPEQVHIFADGLLVTDERGEPVPNPKWHPPRQVLRVLAATRLPRSAREGVRAMREMVRGVEVSRALVTAPPARPWLDAMRGLLYAEEQTNYSPAELEEARSYAESMMREERLAVDPAEVSSELSALDVNASAFVACVVHAARLDLAGAFLSRQRIEIYDNEQDAAEYGGEEIHL